jgi:hypothetical protein
MTAEYSQLSEGQLIELSQNFLEHGTGFYSDLQPDLFAEDFIFRGGVVGPLNKKDYLRTMRLLGVSSAFDVQSNAFGFTPDPSDPMCIRFFIRNIGEHVKPWQPWGKFPPTPLAPTSGKTKVIGPTETGRLCFDSNGKVRLFSTGLVVGRFETTQREANTNGLGAVLGLFHAIGFGPVGNIALNKQVRVLSNMLSDKFDFLQIPKTKTSDADIPSWWTE